MLILVENKTQNTAGKYNGNRPCFKFPHRNKGGQKQKHALVIHKVFAVAQHQGRRRTQRGRARGCDAPAGRGEQAPGAG